ncbi:MAG: type II toxin-antitoxin system VapC family toxin [Aurantimonas endophytica]|uniref:Ribonuclease VapC n=1 Tax=Aurantimonas endophytica TaxID=1522175 RepID=A0A7W6MQT7_9HYPH|nr:type II toxin-antitoxin system VapC family toxin [Aurantimonas endophytica]MBB4004324.1 ribonuclease VapC [Aurantimonas endophytica]MCO6405164.1 PIN domain-containing protein [Aurantimonas endophytica]
MFVDASALCALVLEEEDAETILARMKSADRLLVSPTVIWETVISCSRRVDWQLENAQAAVLDYLIEMHIAIVAIPPEAAALAVEAYARFGKGRHKAGLNFGDCFAYACARHFDVPLLYKGDDFAHTDIAAA